MDTTISHAPQEADLTEIVFGMPIIIKRLKQLWLLCFLQKNVCFAKTVPWEFWNMLKAGKQVIFLSTKTFNLEKELE